MMTGTLLPASLTLLVRLLARTWRIRRTGARLLEEGMADGPLVLAFFHGDLLPLAALHRDRHIVAMASLSRDGELISRVLGRLGYRVVRGSSSRRGLAALEEARGLMLDRGMSVTLAVDGPRGPRMKPQHGAMKLAASTGRPVVFAAVTARPSFRLRTWDAFLLPLPFAKVQILYGRVDPPSSGDSAAVAASTVRLGEEMRRLARAAAAP